MANSEPSRAIRGGLFALRLRVRPGFLFTFSVAGLLGVGLLAFVVSRIMTGDIKVEQLTSATRSAELLTASSLAPPVTGRTRPLGRPQLVTLDRAALAARRTTGLQAIGIWDLHSHVIYSTDHRLIGTTVLAPTDVRAALANQTVTTVSAGAQSPIDRFAGQQINVAVPIYSSHRLDPVAAAVIALPYAPVAKEISDRTKRINLILIGAALLFYAALWPRLLRASKALRDQSDPRTQALLRELESGITRDQLVLHYQPIVDLSEGRVVAVEALLRWQHPRRGLLAPSDFLPEIAGDALNARLTRHVIAIALRDCAAWRERGVDAGVNVNLSAANTLDQELPERIGKLLESSGIPAQALGLEVTETAILADPEKATEMLASLDRMGVRIAIDDFGTGYSSLAGLRDLPVSELKIDRQFVAGLCENSRDESIVRSTIRLAHELDVTVLAEGVEDEETLNALAALGCDLAQGFYFSRPQPLAGLVAWFAAPAIAGQVAATEPAPAVA